MGKPEGWLIFGVTDKPPRQVCGTNYRSQRPALDRLKQEIAQHTNNHISFIEIHEIAFSASRIIMFQIPPALRGMPTSWKGHLYGRAGESIGPLSIHEIEQIRRQTVLEDWSAQICHEATVNDLDPNAISFARQEYKQKHPSLAEEVEQWDDITFLNKAKINIRGNITRAGIILLGKPESEPFIEPAIARITWILKDSHGEEKDYRHFTPPMILAVDEVFSRIRNLTYRYLPNFSLFPTEISQYDPWVIREILHNCIAHQDYTQRGRINVVEEAESLIFTNLGDFLPGSVEEVIKSDAPPELYRNRFLAEAMVNLNMIDSIGSGIRRMFIKQRQRNFPMPDYTLHHLGRVKVRLLGKVLDERYTRMLIAKTDLDLMDVIALDKVQKRKPLSQREFKSLKSKEMVEGRRPNLYVASKIAAVTETKAEYIKQRAFDKKHFKKLVIEYLSEYKEARRKELDRLLIEKLSDVLSEKQKKRYVTNLLQEMRLERTLQVEGSTRWARWLLSKNPAEKRS